MARYYKHSGKAPLASLLLGLGVGALTASLVGGIYSYIILYLPIAGFITFLLSAGYGAICGFVTAFMLKRGKVRNGTLSMGVVLLGQLIGFYVAWAVWVYALVTKDEPTAEISLMMVMNPLLLAKAVAAINETGAWTMSGTTPSGIFLWILWALEAVLVFGGAWVVSLGVFSGEVYCERCHRWCDNEPGVLLLPPADHAELKRAFEERRFDSLALGMATQEQFITVDVRSCGGCSEMQTLTLTQLTTTINKEGKPETTRTEILAGLLMEPAEVAALREMGKALAATEKGSPDGNIAAT